MSKVNGVLSDAHLVERTVGLQLATTYEATLLARLPKRSALDLTGTKEAMLVVLRPDSKSITELQLQSLAK